ncbi:MAG: hypothetical protein PSX36_12500 [bacterium]|nr:hypothetical protein [bacterium]
MARFAPQYNPHKVTAQIRAIIDFTFWIVFSLSILPFVCKWCEQNSEMKEVLSILNIISILLFFVLEIIVDFILFPQSEQKRRDDFIDNSFGSKFSPANSVEYYDNEELQQGLYKTSTNLFQNSFFTYSLIKELTLSKIIFPSIVLVAVFVFAFFGFEKTPISVTILQVLFSANVLGNLIKHLILLNKLAAIQDGWVSIFQNENFKSDTNKYHASIYRYWLQYEALLSRIQPNIPEKVFKSKNALLTEEWIKIKTKYQIQ